MIIPVPTWFFNLIFLPGRIVHAFITQLLVNRYELDIYTLNYLEIDPKISNVIHQEPNAYREKYSIVLIPFFTNIFLSIFSYYYSFIFDNQAGLSLLFIYLGITFSYAAFPTSGIAKKLWKNTIVQIKEGEFIAYFLVLFVGFINVIKFLSFFSASLIFALILYVISNFIFKPESF